MFFFLLVKIIYWEYFERKSEVTTKDNKKIAIFDNGNFTDEFKDV